MKLQILEVYLQMSLPNCQNRIKKSSTIGSFHNCHVVAYDSEDEAIRIANDSQYGLHAAVLGTDLSRARRVASQIRSGRVVINNMTDDPQAPWGGFKYSGVGREYGRYGIEAFLETRAILES